MALYSSVIPCAEEADTQTETYNSETGAECSVVLRCAFADRHALVEDIVGGRMGWPHGTYVKPPQAFSASIKPASSQAGLTVSQSIEVPDALVTVNYSSKIEDLVSDSLEPSTEFLTQQFELFCWGSATGDPLVEAEAPGRLVRGFNLVRKLLRVDPPLPAVLLDGPGGINDAAYTSTLLGLTFPVETLLFGNPSIERTIKTDGSATTNITLKFTYKKQGWNKYWRAKTQTFDSMFVRDGAEYKSYEPIDFSSVLY